MDPVRRPRVKICCMMSIQEMRLAVRAGASAVGLVGPMPSGPGPIDDALAAAIARAVPPGVATFLLTSLRTADEIAAHHARVQSSVIQIVDSVSTGTYAQLRRLLPAVKLVQVIHVAGPGSVQEAEAGAPHVDALLLDSGRPGLPVKELGGTGRRHDWTVSRRIRERVEIPVYLAGGLNPGNAREAVESVRAELADIYAILRKRKEES